MVLLGIPASIPNGQLPSFKVDEAVAYSYLRSSFNPNGPLPSFKEG